MDKQLTLLQNWYSSQHNGDWEHGYGIQITTLDNPGWHLRIDLNETQLQDVDFDAIQWNRSEQDWLYCQIEEGKVFQAFCGANNLVEMLQIFNSWAGVENQ